MQNGPNGIIWTVMQSAMIFPFTVGIVFYDVKLTALRLAGIILMLFSLVLFGVTKSDSSGGGAWKLHTIIAFAISCVALTILNIPFYYKENAGISPVVSTSLFMAGYCVATLSCILWKMNKS